MSLLKKQQQQQKSILKAFDCVDHSNLFKILQELVITDHLPCLLRTLHEGQEATVRTGHGQQNVSNSGKE